MIADDSELTFDIDAAGTGAKGLKVALIGPPDLMSPGSMSDLVVPSYRHTPPAPPVIPSDLSGLARWYKADDAATVIASAGSVSQWTDKAGGDDNLTQGNAVNRPVTGTRTINGRNALDFDGDDFLAAATSLAQPLTSFVVAQSDLATTTFNR